MKTFVITQLATRLQKAKPLAIAIFMFLFSTKAFSQDPGGNPDGPPPAVPFDSDYHYLLIFAGIVMGLFILHKMQRKIVVK